MDTIQLSRILGKDKFTRDLFRGVFAADQLPKFVTTFPSLYVVNTDTSNGAGQHWVVLYFSRNNNTEMFDSYGNPPDMFRFNDFVERNSKTVTFNSLHLQGNRSITCGGFCVYFALNRCRGVKMFDIVSRFSKNKNVNDEMIKEFMYSRYSINFQ